MSFRQTLTFGAVLILCALGVLWIEFAEAKPSSQHNLANIGSMVDQAGRSCVYPSGGWTIVDCSAAVAASSAELTEWTRYVVQCGDDSYLAWGTATGQAADTNDGWVPSGAWLEFLTTDSVKFLSCRNKNVDSDCRIIECR